jgi:MFS-type transporter involved in bile tolerance (Atg22 family)
VERIGASRWLSRNYRINLRLGELIGYSLRFVFGLLTDKKKNYWTMTIIGYIIDVFAVPALAFVHKDGWILACALLILERMGKAIKKPAKSTIVSFAASQEGAGKSFAIQEVLDQIGAFIGPVILYLVMLFQDRGHIQRICPLLCSSDDSGSTDYRIFTDC